MRRHLGTRNNREKSEKKAKSVQKGVRIKSKFENQRRRAQKSKELIIILRGESTSEIGDLRLSSYESDSPLDRTLNDHERNDNTDFIYK